MEPGSSERRTTFCTWPVGGRVGPGWGRLRGLGWRFRRDLARRFRFGAGVGLGLLGDAPHAAGQPDGGSLRIAALGYYDRAYRTAQWPGTLLTALIARAGFYTHARLQDDAERLAGAA